MNKMYLIQRWLKMLLSQLAWKPRQSVRSDSHGLLECDSPDLGRFVWKRLLPIVDTKPFPPNEIMLMAAAVLHVRPDIIIEWGTNIGVSARVFYEVSAAYGVEVVIHSIDLPATMNHIEHPRKRRGMLVRTLPVMLHEGDGPVIAQTLLLDARRPLVFIDGDHSYESVLRDGTIVLNAAPHAAILFHDTFFQPVAQYNHGPYEAVRLIIKKLQGQCQVLEASLGLPGMTLVLPTGTSR